MQYVSQYLAEYLFLWTCRAVLKNRRCVIEFRNASKRYSCKSTPSVSVLTNVYGVSTRSQSNSWWVNSMVIFDFTYSVEAVYTPIVIVVCDPCRKEVETGVSFLCGLTWTKPGSFPSVWSKYHWDLTCDYLQNKKIQYTCFELLWVPYSLLIL